MGGVVSGDMFAPAMTVQTVRGDVRILFRCRDCAAAVDSNGRERHLAWHRGQAGESSPPVLDQRTGDLVRTTRRLVLASEALPAWLAPYMTEVAAAVSAFHPDEG